MSDFAHGGILCGSDGLSTDDSTVSRDDTESGTVDQAPEGGRESPCSGTDRRLIHSLPPALPINWGSQQWRLMRRAIRDGASLEDAAEANGMSLTEARILAKLDADRAPLPPEAFTLLYDPAARAAQTAKEADMADEDDEQTSTEVKQMDFAGAKRMYEADISPEKTQGAVHMQAVGEAYKVIKKQYHIQPQAAKMAFKVFEMEEMHGDDFLRGFAGLVNEMFGRKVLTFHGGDLVDMAEDLATFDADDDFEMSEEELAGQEGRGPVEEPEPAPGTGASARKKMKESATADAAPALH